MLSLIISMFISNLALLSIYTCRQWASSVSSVMNWKNAMEFLILLFQYKVMINPQIAFLPFDFWVKINDRSIFTIRRTFTNMPQHLSEVASQLGYSSVDSVTLEDMVLEVSQQCYNPWHRQSCMCLYFGKLGTSLNNLTRIQLKLTSSTFSYQIVKQIERLIRTKAMMEAAGKPF